MEEEGFAILKALASELQGAPFPKTVSRELYAIWYEHMQKASQNALEYLARNAPDYRPEQNTLDPQLWR